MNRRDKILRRVAMERVVVTLHAGETFDGLLADADDSVFKLVDAYALDGNDRMSVDGALYLPRENVAYIQRPGG